MQINNLKLRKRKKVKTIGRGGKSGTYSGRGNKGQKARSGAHVDPLFEGGRSTLIDHLKKKKGFKSKKTKPKAIKMAEIGKHFQEGETVSLASLMEKGILGKMEKGEKGVKILGGGNFSKKVKISREIRLSQTSRKALEKAGAEMEKEK